MSSVSFSDYVCIQNLAVRTVYVDSLVLHLQYETWTKTLPVHVLGWNGLVSHHKCCEVAAHSEHPFPLVQHRSLQVVGMKISQIGMR